MAFAGFQREGRRISASDLFSATGPPSAASVVLEEVSGGDSDDDGMDSAFKGPPPTGSAFQGRESQALNHPAMYDPNARRLLLQSKRPLFRNYNGGLHTALVEGPGVYYLGEVSEHDSGVMLPLTTLPYMSALYKQGSLTYCRNMICQREWNDLLKYLANVGVESAHAQV